MVGHGLLHIDNQSAYGVLLQCDSSCVNRAVHYAFVAASSSSRSTA